MSPAQFISTRGAARTVPFSAALLAGLAPDGGLYVPVEWPRFAPEDFGEATGLAPVGARLLAPFLAGDPLASALPELTREAFDFPAPLTALDADERLRVLELFHGPTAAFKDFGARFLAACFARLEAAAPAPLTILVATSGDTGGAVAAAFHGRPGIEVAVLFPKGAVSPLQEQQLTCWGGNVHSLRVRGTFDDCQRLVKQAFREARTFGEGRAVSDAGAAGARGRVGRPRLSSANSINLGRLLPQAVYYALSSLSIWRRHREPASFIVPSGNLGNALACLWARRLGLPIAHVVLAHNANRAVPDYLASGNWRPRASVATLASAMDVGDPSNMERLRTLFPELPGLRSALRAVSVSDEEIRARIRADHGELGRVWCPHTATAAHAWRLLPQALRSGGRWVLVATAHPAKFREIVEPLIGRAVAVPATLTRLFARPTQCAEIDATPDALRAALEGRG